MAIDPTLKRKKAAQRKAARERRKSMLELEDEFQEQEVRVKDRLRETTKRLRAAHIQERLDDMDAQMVIHRHVGTGGHMGRRLPSLDEYDRTDERLTTKDE